MKRGRGRPRKSITGYLGEKPGYLGEKPILAAETTPIEKPPIEKPKDIISLEYVEKPIKIDRRKKVRIVIPDTIGTACAKLIPFTCLAIATKEPTWNLSNQEAADLGVLWREVLEEYLADIKHYRIILLVSSIISITMSKAAMIKAAEKEKEKEEKVEIKLEK